MKAQIRSMFSLKVLSVIFAAGIVCWGLILTGSPQYNRRMASDDQRMRDLSEIERRIHQHFGTHGKLPEKLEQIDCSRYGWTSCKVDPEDGEPYRYTVTGEFSFELCATFQEARTVVREYSYDLGLGSSHPAGDFCFPREVEAWARNATKK